MLLKVPIEDEAEDVVQDCFVKLISRSIMPENIKAFLYWTVTMYGRPLKTAAGSARPRRRFRSYGSWAVATTTGRKEAGSDTDTLLSGVPIFMDGTDGL